MGLMHVLLYYIELASSPQHLSSSPLGRIFHSTVQKVRVDPGLMTAPADVLAQVREYVRILHGLWIVPRQR